MLKPEEQKLVDLMPDIAWENPISVRSLDSDIAHLGCRFCIALHGVKGSDIAQLPVTRAEFDAHMKRHSMA